MPKKVYDEFIRALSRDVITNYSSGDKYLSVRGVSEKFSVSLQTAQKGISELRDSGLLRCKPNSGITVTSQSYNMKKKKRKTIFVISNMQDGHFFSSFFDGVRDYAATFGIKTEFKLNTIKNTSSLEFGEYLTELKADGLVMLSFPNSELPFYHAMREGVDIVSDIILDNLPTLPAVQTNNYMHSFDAGMELVRKGCTEFYVFGYYRKQNNRFLGFADAVKTVGLKAKYVEITSISGITETAEILTNCSEDTGLFIGDYSSAYVIDSLCMRQNFKPKNILIYDTDTEYFKASYLPPIKAVGPSFKVLGERLCKVLVYKWQNGTYPEPLQVKI